MRALVLFVVLSGCATTAQWKTTGIDAAKCLAPAVVDSAGDALISLLNQAAGQSVDYGALGTSLVSQYGTKAAICAIGKAWFDLGANHLFTGRMDNQRAALSWLIAHQSEWAK